MTGASFEANGSIEANGSGGRDEPEFWRATMIVNPQAGRGRAVKAAPHVAKVLSEGGWSVTTASSADLADAEQMARRAAEHGHLVVSLGGDGLAGALAGQVEAVGGTLAVLPGGRGNDFVRSLGHSNSPVAAAKALLSATSRLIDVGHIETVGERPRTFLGVAGMGFDSYVQGAISNVELDIGRAIYAYGVVKALRTWHDLRFKLAVDGVAHDLDGWLVAVANSGVYGGGMRIAPTASMCDDKLDVVAVSSMSKMRFLATFPKVFLGSHLSHPSVRSWRASEVHISCDRPVPVYADGEFVGGLPARIAVRARAIRILA